MNPESATFYSPGKLLLTGEYLVLDGAKALAVPARFGQEMRVGHGKNELLNWKSYDEKDNLWFEGEYSFQNNEIHCTHQSDFEVSKRLLEIFNIAQALNPNFHLKEKGFQVTTSTGFPQHWGLGTSSTLINNVATWAKVDAYSLLAKTFGGSGYDIACAQNVQPLIYHLQEPLKNKDSKSIELVQFNPSFRENLYFVHLNKKQNSRSAIQDFRHQNRIENSAISEINDITLQLTNTNSLAEFNHLLNTHESIISKVINKPTVKSSLFRDFEGSIKSLGAWGGDFVLVTSEKNPYSYFSNKGFETVLGYSDMVL